MVSPKEIINRIITIGFKENYAEMELVNPKCSDGHFLCDHSENFWKENTVNLSTEEITELLKSLVYADGRFKNWSTYSAMHYCHYLLDILLERFNRDFKKYDNLLNWIFMNRSNTYIPYIGGNTPLGVNSLQAYRKYYVECEKERLKREKEKKREYDEAQIRKKLRKELAVKNKENNVIAQLKRKNDRKIFLFELKTKSQLEVFKTIIADDSHSICYYPEDFATYDEEIIKQLSPFERNILINKLDNSRGVWRILRNRIKKGLSNLN